MDIVGDELFDIKLRVGLPVGDIELVNEAVWVAEPCCELLGEGVAVSLLVDDADAPRESDCDCELVNEAVWVAESACEPLGDRAGIKEGVCVQVLETVSVGDELLDTDVVKD